MITKGGGSTRNLARLLTVDGGGESILGISDHWRGALRGTEINIC